MIRGEGQRDNYWRKFQYSPASFLGWALESGWEPGTLPVGVVYTFQPVAAQFAEASPDRFVENTALAVSNARMFMTSDEGDPVLVASLNPGGASMATQLEHLRFLSMTTRYAVIVGTAGALVEGLHFGDVVVVSEAIRAESISDRYLPPELMVRGDSDFAAALHRETASAHRLATTWSVAVPYRQTTAGVDEARSQGATVVEMEIASLFAVAAALDMQAAAAVIISDVSRADGWESNWSDTAGPIQQTVLNAITTIRSLSTTSPYSS